MIQSMTGFGKSYISLSKVKTTIEIKSLNGRYLDCYIRVPPRYREKEIEIRKMIETHLQRGKVDFFLNEEKIEFNKQTLINADLIKQYMEGFRDISPESSDAELLSIVTRIPDITIISQEELDEKTWQNIRDGILTAIEQLVSFRKDEGSRLEVDLKIQLEKIQDMLKEIEPYEKEQIEKTKNKLTLELKRLEQELDKNRIEQELIYYLEKMDINEEKVRLRNHCFHFLEELNFKTSNGKKLNFIAQEMGREINTLGAKANSFEIQKFVVQMKDRLERIRQQLMNIL